MKNLQCKNLIYSAIILMFLSINFSYAQQPIQTLELNKSKVKITLLKVFPKFDSSGKIIADDSGHFSSESNPTELQTVYLDTGEVNGEIFAKILKQTFEKEDFFTFTIENKSDQDLYIGVFDFVEGNACEITSLFPITINNSDNLLSKGKAINNKRLLYRATDNEEDNIVFLASSKEVNLQQMYLDDTLLQGIRGATSQEGENLKQGISNIRLTPKNARITLSLAMYIVQIMNH